MIDAELEEVDSAEVAVTPSSSCAAYLRLDELWRLVGLGAHAP